MLPATLEAVGKRCDERVEELVVPSPPEPQDKIEVSTTVVLKVLFILANLGV